MNWILLAVTLLLPVALQGTALAAAADAKEAQTARKKPLQRCDELADKAQIECLAKARERILEARKKRETAGEKRSDNAKTITPQAPAKVEPKKAPK